MTQHQATGDSVRIYEHVPQLARIRKDVLLGDVWKQPELAYRDRILVTLGVPPDQVSVLLNHRSAKASVQRASVELRLGKPVDVEMLFDGGKPDDAALHGNILSLIDPRSEVTKGVETLAQLLESAQPPAAVEGASPAGEAPNANGSAGSGKLLAGAWRYLTEDSQ